ncbi:MAG: BamA/TamA family outer membrane protein [Cyclobacteriaceae bacterium]|nr:BamA/TamA family outer membrane protein [Cyclobacteriaceae bacterium]
MMVRCRTGLLFGLMLNASVYAQGPDSSKVDLIDVVIGRKNLQKTNPIRSGRKVYFSLFPAATTIPGGGRAVVTSVSAAFYLGDPTETNLSNVYLIPYTNLSDRYGIYLRPNIWVSKNTYNFIGDYRLAHFPQYSWGLGGDSPEWAESLIDSDYVRFYQTVLRKIKGAWFIGPGYALDYHYNISESGFTGERGHLDRYEEATLTSTTSSGFTFNFVYDARINAINPPDGAYVLLSYRWNDKALGSTYTNHSLFVDARKYFSLSHTRSHILAIRSYYWTIINGNVPYLDLPASNWAPATGIASRGFQSGRYRSNAMVYAEGEQRYQLTENGLIGFVAFMNVSSASEFDTQQFKIWQVGAGAGIRIKFNKYSNSNLAVDVGFSQHYWSVWLNIGEMF